MFYYARADTHFLLYIYDNMRNELIDKANPEAPEQNCTELVLQKSKETSLLRFERQVYNMESGKGPGGWYQLLVKTPALFSNEQFAVFRAVHAWRDQVARLDDDSTAFVMPNHVIFSIAKLLPLDMVALLAIAHPISHTVKSRSGELLDLIKTARAQGQHGPSMMDVLRPDSVGAVVKANLAVGAAKSAPTPLLAVVDESNLVSEQSSFWGGAFGSSIWDAPTFSKKEDELRLAVPLPQLSSEIFATSNGLADRSREKAKSSIQDIQPITPASNKSNESFILKRGLEPKGEVQNEPEETTSKYDDAPNSSEDHGPSGKATSKAERRAARKLRKQQRKSTTPKEAEPAGPGEVVGEEPFDYSKAQSVLHGKRKGGEQGGPKSKKPFDPYAKSADAPKGMRRLQSEREGKSHTFKS
jgi:exosome complex exonuclease RRP6